MLASLVNNTCRNQARFSKLRLRTEKARFSEGKFYFGKTTSSPFCLPSPHIFTCCFPFILNKYIRLNSRGRIADLVRLALSADTEVLESSVRTGNTLKCILH